MAPRRHAGVEPDEIGIGAHEVGQRPDQHASPTITTSASVSASPVAAAGSSLAASAALRPLRRRIAAPASRAVAIVDVAAPVRRQQSAATMAATAVATRTNTTIVTGTSAGGKSVTSRSWYPVDPEERRWRGKDA